MIYKSKSILPSGYQEVEYLQSTGSQYIDTEYIPTINTKMVVEISSAEEMAQMFAGGRRSSNNSKFTINMGNPNNSYVAAFGSETNVLLAGYDSNRHSIEISNSAYIFDSVKIKTPASYTGVFTYSIYLFGCNTAGSLEYPAHVRMYSCKLYENEVIARNFIPCYRKSDNENGMYDTVTNTFYTNQGTGTFAKGEDIEHLRQIKSVYKGEDIEHLRQIKSVYKGYFRLPSEYQEIEYTESNDHLSWVGLGLSNPYGTIGIKLDFQLLTNESGTIIGGLTSSRASRLIGVNSSGYFINRGTMTYFQNVSPDTKRNVLLYYFCNDGVVKFEGYEPEPSAPSFLGNFDNFSLFKAGSSTPLPMRVFDLQISVDTNVIRHYVPCYRKDDGEIGLYELVENVFYSNSGTGALSKGNDVANYKLVWSI